MGPASPYFAVEEFGRRWRARPVTRSQSRRGQCRSRISGAREHPTTLVEGGPPFRSGQGTVVNMGQSVSTCLRKYVDFSGRASRSEYWYFVLFTYLVSLVFAVTRISALSTLASLGLFLPSLGAGVRRLHDTNRSGWWLLFPIVNLVFLAQPTKSPDATRSSGPLLCPNGHHIEANSTLCPSCGVDTSRRCVNEHVLGPAEIFCPKCGEGVPQRCPNGHAVAADAQYCPTCGSHVG
jgi:ribosomal protein S27AE